MLKRIVGGLFVTAPMLRGCLAVAQAAELEPAPDCVQYSSDGLHNIQRAEYQPSDAEAEWHGDAWRPELQWRFQERDGEHHAEPQHRNQPQQVLRDGVHVAHATDRIVDRSGSKAPIRV